jgi:fibronectin-binding autotransporter adhesin
MRHTHLMLCQSFLAGCTTLALASAAWAGNPVNLIVVTTSNDSMDAFDQQCSLREAIYNANNNEAFSPVDNECVAGSGTIKDVIVLQSGQTYSLTRVGPGDDEGDLDITDQVFPGDIPSLRIEVAGGISPATIQQTVAGQRVLHVQDAKVELDSLIIRGGVSGDGGGGIYNQAGRVTLTNVSVQNNSGSAGGGIYNQSEMTLVDSQVLLNSASGLLGGGGIYNASNSTLAISDTLVRVNHGSTGGGIYNDGGTLTINNGSVSINTASSGNGGGIANGPFSRLTISGTAFESNTANGAINEARGGAIHSLSIHDVEISNGQFAGNQARNGGALWIDSTVVVGHSSFDDNTAVNDGGAVNADVLLATSSRFSGNTAGIAGGAISTKVQTTLQDSLVNNNTAAVGGGVSATFFTMNSSEISGNSAFGSGGGAAAEVVSISDSRFLSNDVSGAGGGLHVNDTFGVFPGRITRSVFTDNHAGDEGGGLWLRSKMTISNTTIALNGANNGGGGIFIHSAGDIGAYNMTLSGHLNGQDLHKYGILRMQNSIISTPGQPDCLTSLQHPTIISLGNNIADDASCFGLDLPSDQINTDPRLEPLDNYGGNTLTFALQPGSPAIDAGNNTACNAAPVNGVDQRGGARPAGAACDIGAHENGAEVLQVIFANGFE